MTFATQIQFAVMDAFVDRIGPLARQTQIECELIEKGLSPSEIDRCAPGRLERYLLYWSAKGEKLARDSEQSD